jgi:HlyD family secretion protein
MNARGVFQMIQSVANNPPKANLRFGAAIMAEALLILVALLQTSCTLQAPSASSGIGTGEPSGSAVVERGDFKHVLRLTGRVQAVESYNIKAPRLMRQRTGTLTITKILPSGERVKKGDILVELDRQDQLQNILDRQAEYDDLEQQIKKKRADQAAALAADITALKGAEVDLQTAKAEMRKNDIISKNDAAVNVENLKEAEAKLKQLQDTFDLKREAEAADLRILEIQRDRARKIVSHERDNIENMTIRSPMDGLVVLMPMSKGTRRLDPEEGDEVRPGAVFMLVVNPDAMEVTAAINQVDVSKITVGQAAEVHLDAYPELHFPGTVEHISAIGVGGSNSTRIRTFGILVSVQGKDPKLLPDLTAAVDIQMETYKNVLLLPRNAVIFRENQAVVEVLENGASEIREVQTGSMNECEIIIESGLDEGTTVALSPKIPDTRL